MSMAYQPLAAVVSQLVSVTTERGGNLRLDGRARSDRAPLRKTSVSGSAKLPGWESSKTLVSVTAYHLYGAISVKRYSFSISCSYGRACVRLALIVRHEPERKLEATRSEGSSPFSANHRAAYLYSVGPIGTRTMMQ